MFAWIGFKLLTNSKDLFTKSYKKQTKNHVSTFNLLSNYVCEIVANIKIE